MRIPIWRCDCARVQVRTEKAGKLNYSDCNGTYFIIRGIIPECIRKRDMKHHPMEKRIRCRLFPASA